MDNPNLLASQKAPLVGIIDPDAYGTGAESSGWVDMTQLEQVQALVLAGDMGASGTIDAKLEQAQDSSGTGAKDITGKAITQLTQAGGDSNKQAVINCRSEELDVENSFNHVRLTVTVGGAACDAAGLVLGASARYQPADDLASVDEIVN